MDGGLENKWLMDSDFLRHMTGNKKWFFNLTPLSHKKYMTFGDDKKGKVLGTGIIKVNDYFTLNDVALVDKLKYNLFSISQLVYTDLVVLFRKSDSQVLILLASLFVIFLASKKSFKLIFHLLKLL
jgi:hypothetical protein